MGMYSCPQIYSKIFNVKDCVDIVYLRYCYALMPIIIKRSLANWVFNITSYVLERTLVVGALHVKFSWQVHTYRH